MLWITADICIAEFNSYALYYKIKIISANIEQAIS